MLLTAVLMPTEEGGFVAFNPETGTTTQGEPVDEAVGDLREATALYLEEFPAAPGAEHSGPPPGQKTLPGGPKCATNAPLTHMKPATRPPKPSRGTLIAAECRARMNTYTDEQRQALLHRGLARIYSAAANADKARARSR
jgi:predicted RNase H-like HicB family nuclease